MTEAFLSALHADPWNETLIDLDELNREASSLIESQVLATNASARKSPSELRSSSLVLLGPPGTGKTHLFSRLRKHLGPRAVFVHLRPLLHAGLTPSFVLNEAVMQLGQASYKQLQADALVGSLIGHLEGLGADFPSAHLSTYRDLSESERAKRLEALADKSLEIFPDLDESFVDRLLMLPFCEPRKRRALLAWMAGQDCDPSQLSRIGASASMAVKNTVRALRSLGSLASLGAPLVLVFDQLENLIQRDTMEERITQYGNLVAELVDATRGLLVVQMALDSEWEQGIEPRLNLSQRSRVVMRKTAVSLPTPAQNRDLLKLWCGRLEEPENAFPWPFSENQIDKLVELPGLTPRMALSALREAREGLVPTILQVAKPGDGGPSAREESPESGHETELNVLLEEEWHTRLVSAHHQIDQAEVRRGGIDPGRLVDGIILAAGFCAELFLRGTSNQYIQIESHDSSGRWLSLLHQSHPSSIGAALERALGKDSGEPGVVLREQWRAFSPTWKASIEKQNEIIARPYITWHELPREEAASFLALEEMLQLARSRDICDAKGLPLSVEQVQEFLSAEVHPEQWPLIVALQEVDQSSPISRQVVQAAAEEMAAKPESAKVSPLDSSSRTSWVYGSEVLVGGVLQRLRLASVDRVIRETRRLDPELGRIQVLDGLEKLGERVEWFGRNIVAWGVEK